MLHHGDPPRNPSVDEVLDRWMALGQSRRFLGRFRFHILCLLWFLSLFLEACVNEATIVVVAGLKAGGRVLKARVVETKAASCAQVLAVLVLVLLLRQGGAHLLETA